MGTRQGSGGGRRILRGAAAAVAVLALAAITGCGDRFPDPEQTGEFNRVVLLEEGTGTWCINCPDAAENIQALIEADTGGLIVLALHSQESDPYTTAETEARLTRLGVSAYPTLVFDAVEVNVGAMEVSQMQQMLSDRRALGSPLKIELSASLTSDSISYEITIIVSDKTPENTEGTLRIALVEESVDYSNAIWDGLDHVVRRLPAAGSGDELTLQPGDTVNLHRALPLDLAWGTPLMAVVWVEGADLEVYQAASYEITEGPDLGDFSIKMEPESDTVQTASQPGDTAFYYFTLKNHTDNQLTLHIETPNSLKDLPSGWNSQIYDGDSYYDDSLDVGLPANEASQKLHVRIASSAEGTEGKVVITVSGSGTEVDTLTFILQTEEPDLGDFSIEVVGDSIKTDTLGAMVNFYFTLKNHTGNDLTLTVDVPEATQELPTGWWFSLCDESNCYPVPHDFEVPASDKLEGVHVTIGSYGEGTEGRLVLTVTDGGEEVDKQSFTLKIAQ